MSNERQAWIVGGGIAALATAALLVRDAGLDGDRIHVLEQSNVVGGSLDGAGSPVDGYRMRGGRMLEPHYACTYDLFDTVPALDGSGRSVTQTIHDFTRAVVPSSRCRLVRTGRRVEAPPLGLGWRDRLDLFRLALQRERSLGTLTIDRYFRAEFFDTPFWLMWSTMFAFQPWHSVAEFRRYMRRLIHLMPGFNRLEGIERTPLNQYDSMVLPLKHWLGQQGVDLRPNHRVTAIDFDRRRDPARVMALQIEETVTGAAESVVLGAADAAFITLGSMTENSTFGGHRETAPLKTEGASGAWDLWRAIAAHSSRFGRPEAFCGDIERTRWLSFTVTLNDSAFFDHMQCFTGNRPGTGGLVTFEDSSWRLSVVLAHQPHFAGQPEGIQVFWGYGLFPGRSGDHVGKPMDDCTGEELLTELAHHLGVRDRFDALFADAICIPCQMPYITSQFMPRGPADRPAVIPEGAENFAFIGQYCEVPRDIVFTVEYSVRSAQMAVYGLLARERRPRPMYRGDLDPRVLWRAVEALST